LPADFGLDLNLDFGLDFELDFRFRPKSSQDFNLID